MQDQKKGIPKEDIEIRQIGRSDTGMISGFSSYEKELVDFLAEDALDNQEKSISTTYLWIHKPTKDLIGYVTVLADAINLHGPLKEYFRREGIKYKSLPALKIGRLCVSDGYLRRGVGTLMIQFAIILAQKLGKAIGLRFLTTDAKRNTDSRMDSMHFYRRLGFDTLKQREKGTLPMYKDLIKK